MLPNILKITMTYGITSDKPDSFIADIEKSTTLNPVYLYN